MPLYGSVANSCLSFAVDRIFLKLWQLGTHEYTVHTWHELEVACEKGELNDSHIKDMRYLASVFGRENG